MYKSKCDKCGRVLEGYSEEHVDYMLKQHRLSKKCKEMSKKVA